MPFRDEIPDLTRDLSFAMWFLAELSNSERKGMIREDLFDELNDLRDKLFLFMDKWDMKQFKKDYFEKYFIEYNNGEALDEKI